MTRFRRGCALLLLSAVPLTAGADVVLDWDEAALAAIEAAKQPSLPASRTMAIVHVAMFEAMNAVEPRYHPYRTRATAPPGASADAAGAGAAHAALLGIFPDRAATLDAAYQASLARIPAGPARTSGLAFGALVAAEVLAQRAADGWDAPNQYRPPTTAGVYIPTALPATSAWGKVTPWLMERGDQFRPPPPPALTSPEWARDYNEIRELGARKSGGRTAEQTDIARFWTITGPLSWIPVVRQPAAAPKRTPLQNARLFALVSMATADAYISVFDAKHAYNFWRPVTATRNADLDGNDATERVPDWEPLIETPLHPEYPCAHCITSGAAAAVLEAEFGSGRVAPFSVTSAAAPGVTRTWRRFADYADEVAMARIYGGVHYRNSNRVGQATGRRIGELAVKGYLKPLR